MEVQLHYHSKMIIEKIKSAVWPSGYEAVDWTFYQVDEIQILLSTPQWIWSWMSKFNYSAIHVNNCHE